MPAFNAEDGLSVSRQVVLIVRLVLDRQAHLRHGEVIDIESVSLGRFVTVPGLAETVNRWLEQAQSDAPLEDESTRPQFSAWHQIDPPACGQEPQLRQSQSVLHRVVRRNVMAIHDGTSIANVAPRISRGTFAEILSERDSPAASLAEDAWNAVEQEGVDPLFALAVFHQESQFGTDPVSATAQFGLRNPGHTRSSRIGVGTSVDTPSGPFIRYPSWTDGWRDLAFRLVDPEFAYAREGRHTIRPIIERWAPPDDNFDIYGLNNTDRYVANVIHNMSTWGDQVDCTPFPPPPFDGTDKQVGDVIFHASSQTVKVARDGLRCQQFAFPNSCETRHPLSRGDTFEALYWVEGDAIDGQRRWWIAESGSRIWGGGTVQQPGNPD